MVSLVGLLVSQILLHFCHGCGYEYGHGEKGESTGTMCNDTPPLDFIFTERFDEPEKSVECAARLEGADALVVFAFKEEAEGWVRGWLLSSGGWRLWG